MSVSGDEVSIQLATQALERFLENPDPASVYSETVLSAYTMLPAYMQEQYLQQFRLKVSGFRVRGFLRAVSSYAAGGNSGTAAPNRIRPDGTRPLIIVNDRQLADVVDECVMALERLHREQPTFFVRGGELVTLVRDELGTLFIRELSARDVRLWLSRAADFIKRGAKADISVSPPLELAEGVLSLGTWNFPPLEAVVTAPVVREDLSLLTQGGYDPATRLFYDPAPAFSNLKIPKEPGKEDIHSALKTIENLLYDFPFSRDCDRANTLALFLTPFLRPLIGDSGVPMAIVDAPVMGTGKSLLAKLLSVIATGGLAAMVSVPHNDEEWRKTLAGILMQGQTLVIFDNVEGSLRTPQLAGVLTSERWSVRVLGTPRHVELVNRATWLATGNNVAIQGDLARRCYRIRLDPGVEKPWQRTGWRHANLLAHAKSRRGETVAALLTLIRYWAISGRPEFTERTMGGFERWTQIVGGILQAAGVNDFLDNVDEIYEIISDDAAEWRHFFHSWWKIFPGSAPDTSKAFTTHELVELLGLTQLLGKEVGLTASAAEVSRAKELFDALPGELAVVFKDGRFVGKERRVGRVLGHKLGRVFGQEGFRLVKTVMSGNLRRWQVNVQTPPEKEESAIEDEIPF